MPNTKPQIDRDALHRIMYRRADRMGRFKQSLAAFSQDLGVSQNSVRDLVIRMSEQGRLKVLGISGGRGGKCKIYLVRNPNTWREESLAEAERHRTALLTRQSRSELLPPGISRGK